LSLLEDFLGGAACTPSLFGDSLFDLSYSESDGNPSTEDESSHGPEETEAAGGLSTSHEGVSAPSSLFLPAACSSASSILLNGNFITASSPPTMLLNGGSVIQTPTGGVILNGLTLGENQTITLSPMAAPSPPILLNGSTSLLSPKAPNNQEISKAPQESLSPATVILSPAALQGEVKSETADPLAFGVEMKSEDGRGAALPPLLSLPDTSTLLSGRKGALLAALPLPQVVPSNEESPTAPQLPAAPQPAAPTSPQIVPLAKLIPVGQALPTSQGTGAAVGSGQGSPAALSPAVTTTPLLSVPGSSAAQATVLHVSAPSLLPLTQVSPPSQVVPLSQPVPGTQLLSPPQMVPVSPTQIYTVSHGAPPPQLVSIPQVAQGSQLISLPQVVPTSQVVTLQQGVGNPIQILTSAAPIKVGPVAGTPQATVATGGLGQNNVHLLNTGVGVTALQLPGTAPGNILLANPATGNGTIVAGMAVQQGKVILTATLPAGLLMTPVLSAPAASTWTLPTKQEVAVATPAALGGPEGNGLLLPGVPSVLPSEVSPLSTSDVAGPAHVAFGTDSSQARLLPSFSQPEALAVSQQQVVWSSPVSMDLQGNSAEGLFEMGKGSVEELRLTEGEGLLLDASGDDAMGPEALDSDEKVLTQLQSVPVEEPLDL
ncbi:homeobox protein SIX5-like, partial [Python bivittatus]|uniref:Homeobox protein SIX5-like n=1 Tax=Python bivittatus TaxID=176946 RepID=A0A9F5N7L3_PYTBI